MLMLLSDSSGAGTSVIFRTIIALTLAATVAQAASDRDMAEWVIRWEGRVILEGNPKPITDISQLPPGDFRIVGVDLTGAVVNVHLVTSPEKQHLLFFDAFDAGPGHEKWRMKGAK